MLDFPPFLIFYLAAMLTLVVRSVPARAAIMLAAPFIGAYNLWTMAGTGAVLSMDIAGMELIVFREDKLSLLFGYLFHIASLIAIIYSLHVKDRLQQVSSLLYAGSALGAVFAGDLITLFVFWEMLALTSVFLIWARRTERAYHSGMRYLLIQVLS
ncbi:MAG: hypothetical protein RLN82_10865, partial [Pseudomonadales bacterium]